MNGTTVLPEYVQVVTQEFLRSAGEPERHFNSAWPQLRNAVERRLAGKDWPWDLSDPEALPFRSGPLDAWQSTFGPVVPVLVAVIAGTFSDILRRRSPLKENAVRRIIQRNGKNTYAPSDILEDLETFLIPLCLRLGERFQRGVSLRASFNETESRGGVQGDDESRPSSPAEPEDFQATGQRVEKTRVTEEQELSRIEQRIKRLKGVRRTDRCAEILGKSPAIRNVIEDIERIKDSPVTVLITGESGVGKELVARALHFGSRRKGNPFVPVNIAALPEHLIASELFGHVAGAFTNALRDKQGMFEVANGGTLFLDEIGDLSANVQVTLLRVLEDRQIQPVGGTETRLVDIRLVAATNRDMETAIRDGRFREDLYSRLLVYEIHVPALRDRKEDIPLLIEHFAGSLSREEGKPKPKFTKEARDKLLLYDWPRNVRELKNCLHTALLSATGGVIDVSHLRFRNVAVRRERLSKEEIEKDLILRTLGQSATVEEAIEKLPMSSSTFYEKCKRYSISPPKAYLGRRR